MRKKVIAGNWKMNKLPNEAIDFIKTHKINDYPKLNKVTSLELFSGLDI